MEQQVFIEIEPIEIKQEVTVEVEQNNSQLETNIKKEIVVEVEFSKTNDEQTNDFIKKELTSENYCGPEINLKKEISETKVSKNDCVTNVPTANCFEPLYDVEIEEYKQRPKECSGINANETLLKNEIAVGNEFDPYFLQHEPSSSYYDDQSFAIQYENSEEYTNIVSSPSYNEIIKNVTSIKRVTCPICKKTFCGIYPFKQHIKTAHPEKLCCMKCNRMFASNGHLRSHIKAMHSGDVACPTCGKTYSNRTQLGRHKLKKHRDKKELYICDMCKKTFNQKYNLMRHISIMHPQNSIKCSQCDNTFKSEKLLQKHMIWNHPIENTVFKCYVCNKMLPSKESHDKHLQESHQWFSMGQCDICNKICTNKKSLSQHMKAKHNATQARKAGKHPCEICGKKFRSTTSLYWHKKQYHSDELKDKVCPICSKQYPDNIALRCHLETVHSLEEATCDICKKSFKSEIYLKRHIREVHSETEKKYVKKSRRVLVEVSCTLCNKTFSSKQLLTTHILSDHTKNYVCCQFCKKYYATKKTLHYHVKRMHGEVKTTAQPCSLCGKVLHSSLARHMLKVHRSE